MFRLSTALVLLAGLANVAVCADNDATIHAEQALPPWASDNSLQLTLTTSGEASPLQYTVIPLTPNLGLNESATALQLVRIKGNLIAADASNYNMIDSAEDVAYLSCDSGKGFMTPDRILHKLMAVEPKPIKAILLYSTSGNWCDLDYSNDLPYTSILSMADAAEAGQALSFLNNTDHGEIVKVSIVGNLTDDPNFDDDDAEKDDNGASHSTVAMSVLYSITGLITVLFLFIIITGAIRAHRYPERYGPRGPWGGRARQSRAKGIARAVLDTIPIVKFGNPSDTKPDPEVELSNAAATSSAPGSGDGTARRASTSANEQRDADHPMATAPDTQTGIESVDARSDSDHPVAGAAVVTTDNTEHVECSICTEDFTVGEDVRVLPCNHQFHPACVDPWLVNVSGTCPLCRLNLQPQDTSEERSGTGATDGRLSATTTHEHPPPLALGDEAHNAATSHRHRLSRLFDFNRLRDAPVEERMAALRQLRAEQGTDAQAAGSEGEDTRQRARLSERLKDRFRVRTRAQSPNEASQS